MSEETGSDKELSIQRPKPPSPNLTRNPICSAANSCAPNSRVSATDGGRGSVRGGADNSRNPSMAAIERSGGGESGSATAASENLKRLEELSPDDAIALACEARGARMRAAENWRRGMRGAIRIDWPLGMFADAARSSEVDVFQFNHPEASPVVSGEVDEGTKSGSGTHVSSSSSSKYPVWLCDLHPLAFSRTESDARGVAASTAAGGGSDSSNHGARDSTLEKQIIELQGSITQLAAQSAGDMGSASSREAASATPVARDVVDRGASGDLPRSESPPSVTTVQLRDFAICREDWTTLDWKKLIKALKMQGVNINTKVVSRKTEGEILKLGQKVEAMGAREVLEDGAKDAIDPFRTEDPTAIIRIMNEEDPSFLDKYVTGRADRSH